MTSPLALEVIATSVDDALAAEQGGAARIELVTALDRGGLTPSMALVEARARARAHPCARHGAQTGAARGPRPARAPTAGRTGARHRTARVDGLVFGALVDGRIDEPLLDAVAGASGRPITFHRAFEDSAWIPTRGLPSWRVTPRWTACCATGAAAAGPNGHRGWPTWAAQAGAGLQMLAGGGITDEALTAAVAGARPCARCTSGGSCANRPPSDGRCRLGGWRTWWPDLRRVAALGLAAVPVALASVRPYTSGRRRPRLHRSTPGYSAGADRPMKGTSWKCRTLRS